VNIVASDTGSVCTGVLSAKFCLSNKLVGLSIVLLLLPGSSEIKLGLSDHLSSIIFITLRVSVSTVNCLSVGEARRDFGETERRRHQGRRAADDLQHSRVKLTHAAGRHSSSNCLSSWTGAQSTNVRR